jgi:hypothetical protein
VTGPSKYHAYPDVSQRAIDPPTPPWPSKRQRFFPDHKVALTYTMTLEVFWRVHSLLREYADDNIVLSLLM